MGQIRRMHYGTAKVPAQLLVAIDGVLDMDAAAPRSVVKPLADRLRDYNRDLDIDMDIECTEGIHPYLQVSEVDAVQRLRGWHRLRYGTVTVDAEALSDVRNVLDTLTLSWSSCHENAEGNPYGYDEIELTYVQAQLKKNEICYRCQWCEFLILRERIDWLLDAQGFTDRNRWIETHQKHQEDPEVTWRTRVTAPTAELVAA
ncbi:MAG: hypothetical protein JWR34_2167 [Mycobacterium sp.]|nr:hypothetical protein [Mycobacterium sp.]